MEGINGLITLLQILIPLGGAARIAYCALVLNMNGEESASYWKRVRNILVFVVLAECAAGFLKMVANYF